jgi:hypothetical protein
VTQSQKSSESAERAKLNSSLDRASSSQELYTGFIPILNSYSFPLCHAGPSCHHSSGLAPL